MFPAKSLIRTAPVILLAILAGCGSDDDLTPLPGLNIRPVYLGPITTATYDGSSDDLLTGGLGWNGLQAATPPPVSNLPPISRTPAATDVISFNSNTSTVLVPL